MKSITGIIASAFLLCFVMCKSATSPDEAQTQGPLHPPAWIQGSWEGGSPMVLHLRFTAGNSYDGDNDEAFPGYTETVISDSLYSLQNGNTVSSLVRSTSTTLYWYVGNGIINNVTKMTKK